MSRRGGIVSSTVISFASVAVNGSLQRLLFNREAWHGHMGMVWTYTRLAGLVRPFAPNTTASGTSPTAALFSWSLCQCPTLLFFAGVAVGNNPSGSLVHSIQ